MSAPETERWELDVCSDCVQLIANGDTGHEEVPHALLPAWDGHHLVVVGDGDGFSWRRCEGCGGLAGDRWQAVTI